MAKKLAAECLGTFALIFAGTGAIVIDEVTGGGVSHVGIALTFGLIVLAMIYSLGDISGAHINPAVTIGFWAARRFEPREVLPYVVSQCAGAFLASILLRFLFPANSTLGATIPTGPLLQSFVPELILTALLMFVILGVSNRRARKGDHRWNRRRLRHWIGSNVCRPDLRRVYESSALTRAGYCQPPSAKPLGLSSRAHYWRASWSFRLPLRARTRLLLRINHLLSKF